MSSDNLCFDAKIAFFFLKYQHSYHFIWSYGIYHFLTESRAYEDSKIEEFILDI